MNKLCVFIVWIWLQSNVSLRPHKNVKIMLNPNLGHSNPNLFCNNDETIVIDEILYFDHNSTDSQLCSKYARECQATQETKYIIHEKCSTKKGNCSISDSLNKIGVCNNRGVTADCLVVLYSCVTENNILDICSNSISTAEIKNSELYITLQHAGSMVPSACTCTVTTTWSPFLITAKDIRLYDANRKCTPSTVAFGPITYDTSDCNETVEKWPYFSTFLLQPLECNRTLFIDVFLFANDKYPTMLIEVKASQTVKVSCGTRNPHGQPITISSTSDIPKVTTLSPVNPTTRDISQTETSMETTPLTESEENSSSCKSEGNILVPVLSAGAGFIAVAVLSVLTKCYIYRRKRKRNPEICFAIFAKSDQRGNKSKAATETDVNKVAPFQGTNAERTMPVTKAIPDDDMLSNYDHIQLQSIQKVFEDKEKTELYSYDHLMSQTNDYDGHSNSASNFDFYDTYNHLDDGFHVFSENRETGTYDHCGDQINAFQT